MLIETISWFFLSLYSRRSWQSIRRGGGGRSLRSSLSFRDNNYHSRREEGGGRERESEGLTEEAAIVQTTRTCHEENSDSRRSISDNVEKQKIDWNRLVRLQDSEKKGSLPEKPDRRHKPWGPASGPKASVFVADFLSCPFCFTHSLQANHRGKGRDPACWNRAGENRPASTR